VRGAEELGVFYTRYWHFPFSSTSYRNHVQASEDHVLHGEVSLCVSAAMATVSMQAQ
jgi:hypothetical protein